MGPRGDRARLPALGRLVEAGGRSDRAGTARAARPAIGHLGNRFEIVASAAGDERRLRVRGPGVPRPGSPSDVRPAPAEEGCARRARATCASRSARSDRKLDPRRIGGAARGHVPPAARGGRGTDGPLNRAPVAPSPWGVEDRHEFVVRAAGRLVRGWWGLLPEVPLPGAPEAGIRLYHLGRLVGAPEWFGHPTPAAHPALNRLVGEVELPHVPVTMNKADIDRGSETWAAVEARLHARPGACRSTAHTRAGLGRHARSRPDRRAGAQDPGQGVAFARGGPAVRIRGRGGGRRARWPAGARRRPKAGARCAAEGGDEEAGVGAPEPRAATEPTPRLPRSGAAGGPGTDPPPRVGRGGRAPPRSAPPQRARRGGRRAQGGDQQRATRSTRSGRGDLWYQLETALREVCVTIPEATVPEFERRVNELMLVSLALAERRRGAPAKGVAVATAVRGRQTGLWR